MDASSVGGGQEPFTQTPELGVFASRRVIENGERIGLVFHHDDGDWEFVTGNEISASEIQLIHVHHIMEWDPSVVSLADLLRGWKAYRGSLGEDWTREPIPADQPELQD